MTGLDRVLVVDDERTVRRACERVLTAEGIEAVTVGRCEEALEWVAKGGFDAVILDLMMPGLGGLQFLRMIRERGSRLPVLVITGFATPEVKQECLALGPAHWIAKPFDPESLMSALTAAMSDQGPRRDP